jgi:alpha-methylacyl-CoA racemase
MRAGHDMNYMALAGILNKFKRTAKGSAPVPPANILADFASASLYTFNLVLQALVVKKEYTVLDCSLAHSVLYLS